jgi:hypothetical protein
MSSALKHVQRGFGVVRPYLHGPIDLPEFLQKTFNAVELERSRGFGTVSSIRITVVEMNRRIRE